MGGALTRMLGRGGGGGIGIQFVGRTAVTEWSNGATSQSGISLTSLTGGIASAPGAGDVVIVMTAHGSSTNTNMDVTGYTELCDLYVNGTIDAQLGIFYKFMGSTPDSTFDVTGMGATTADQVRCFVFRGVNPTNPIDVSIVTQGMTGTGSSVVPAITPVTSGAVIVGFSVACAGNTLNVSTAMANPGAYSSFQSNKLSQVVSAIGYKAWSGSGAEGPHTWSGASGSSTSYNAAQIALRPA